MSAMTPERFKQEMEDLRNINTQPGTHFEMDHLMCRTLSALGYGGGVKVFEETPKGYQN